MKWIVAAGLLLSFLPTAHAIVDMRNANFSDTWTDLMASGSGYDLRVQRTYNSRSLFNGIFGFGWCSDFETTLEIKPEGSLLLTECGGGQRLTFEKRGADPKLTEQTIETILTEVKKRNRSADKKYLDELKERLKHSDSFRQEFARQLKLKGKIEEGTVYYASGRENENIVLKNNVYIRTLADGTNQRFDLQGRLTHMYDKNGNYLKMLYEKNRLIAVLDNNGRRLAMTYDPSNNKVKKITGPNGLSVVYKYNNEDLTEVTNAWKNTFHYKYDNLHNMVEIRFPDKTKKVLTYDKDRDWVTSFTNRKGCVENYTYGDDPKDPLNHYWSTVVKTCDGKVVNQSRYEFFHKIRADGVRYLYRAISDNNGDKSDVVYHHLFGKPISIVRNGIRVGYDYYKNGLMQKKVEQARTTAFFYENSCKKVSHIMVSYYQTKIDPKTKKQTKNLAKTVRTDFKYDDKRCNLIAASNSDGQSVKISYDSKGRIDKIIDQAKKLVLISYEERFGKPEVITRPGLGTIKIKYRADGEVAGVESKEEGSVAVQVASIFNNLLDLIAPATSEMSL